MQMIIALIDAVYHDPETMANTHYPIVDALMSRDVEASRLAMREHLDDAWQQVRALFVKQHGDVALTTSTQGPAR